MSGGRFRAYGGGGSSGGSGGRDDVSIGGGVRSSI